MRHSVIMSSYNRPKMISEAIMSVRGQRGDFELIVADDASNEVTHRAIRAAFDGDPRCQLMVSTTPREGDGAVTDPTVRAVNCINEAIAQAQGDLFHYLPDDDWYAVGRFEAFESWFEMYPALSVAYGRMMHWQDGRVTGSLYTGQILTKPSCSVDHGQFAHRRGCFDRVPRWPVIPGNFSFDAAFFEALVAAGYPLYPVDAVVNFKRLHGKNLQRVGFATPPGRE